MTTGGCAARLERRTPTLQTLVLENERLRVTVLVSKGADVHAIEDRASGVDLLAKAPWGLRDPGLQPPVSSSLVGWMDRWSGGWQVLFPSGGDACMHQGVELDYHGEASLQAWSCELVERDDAAEALLGVTLTHSPFRIERRMTLPAGSSTLVLEETVTNLGGDAESCMWVHHPMLGAPFLEGGCRIAAGARTVIAAPERDSAANPLVPGAAGAWPNAVAKDGGTLDLSYMPGPDEPRSLMAYLGDFDEGWLSVVNPRLELGIGFTWPADVLPHAWLFQEVHASPGYPWYRRAYVMGTEPASGTPATGLARAVADGTALELAPGASRTVELRATVLRGGELLSDRWRERPRGT